MRTLFAILLLLLTLPPTAQAIDTEALFAARKDSVFQIRVLERSSASKSSIGSGFLVSRQGHIISNYHVVAALVHKPERYQLEYVAQDGRRGPLQLLDVDVIHDLALLRTDAPLSGAALELAAQPPLQGERLYSLGNPHDLGLTIVEGIYNGLLDKSLYDKIHFTGAINPGMSGGPTLNRNGAVVGVNVATGGNQLGFLVPVTHVARLLGDLQQPPPPAEQLTRRIRDQLLANQERYMDRLLAAPLASAELEGYRVPGQLGDFINCWGDSQRHPEQLIERVQQSCSSQDDIFLGEKQNSGAIRYRHELYRSLELGTARLYRYLEQRLQNADAWLGGERDRVSNFACDSGLVQGDGLSFKAVLCLRGYKKLADLYDVVLLAATLNRDDQVLLTTLALSGVSLDNARRFPQAYLESIRWIR